MSDSSNDVESSVWNRQVVFCSECDMNIDEQIVTCPICNDFYLFCCIASHHNEEINKPCHHSRIIFTDGACSQNGQHHAISGIGVAFGQEEGSQFSLPVTEAMDPGRPPTSQRAELLAACTGIRIIAEVDEDDIKKNTADMLEEGGPPRSVRSWIIASDSLYVVKGMTEWLPDWKVSSTVRY